MWTRILLQVLLATNYVGAQLDCYRIPITFCCTSRIRVQCAEKCASVQCGNDFIHSLFSIDGPKSSIKDGSANIGHSIGNSFPQQPEPNPDDGITSISKPDELPFSNSGDAHIIPSRTSTINPDFPTLIPSTIWPTTISPPTVTPRRDGHRRRTTPDPRIIRPPETLVVIGDYDEDEPPSENAIVEPIDISTTVSPEISEGITTFSRPRKEISQSETAVSNSGISSTQRNINRVIYRRGISRSTSSSPQVNRSYSNRLVCHIIPPGRLSCNRPVIHPRYITSRHRSNVRMLPKRNRNFSTSQIHITPINGEEILRRRRKLDSGSSAEWKVSILPRSRPASINSIPPLAIDGNSGDRFNKFYRTMNKVIENLEVGPGGDLHIRNGEKFEERIKLEGSTKDISIESSAKVVPRTTVAPGTTNKVNILPFKPLHFTSHHGLPPSASPPPSITSTSFLARIPSELGPKCGIAPDFIPCVNNEIASRSLLECCKRKNLPAGCQELCRYNITQAEIRAAMDRGQCGIFNVAPFLECASQGKDNSECCRHRGVVQKTGPQCEQFCRPTQGLSALGIQHIVCGNAVGDMLQCHHSGIRS